MAADFSILHSFRLSLAVIVSGLALATGAANAIGIHAGGFGGGFGGMGHGMAGIGGYGMGGFRPSMPMGGMGGMGGFSPNRFSGSGFNPGNFANRGLQPFVPSTRPSIPAFAGGRMPYGFNRSMMPGYGGFGRAQMQRPLRPATSPQGRLNPTDINRFLGINNQVQRPGNVANSNPFAAGYAGHRASWNHLTPAAASQVHGRIHDAVQPGRGKMNNWLEQHPQRAQQFQNRADQLRNRWNEHGHEIGGDFWSQQHPRNQVRPGSDWWSKYHPDLDKWYYHHHWHHHDWPYWWGWTAWPAIVPWFADWGWTEPIYYDYGAGGNVVFNDGNVYVNGQDVGTTQDYAQSAAELATVPPTADADADNKSSDDQDWLPLGTFAVDTSDHNTDPSRILQLAINKQGIISGTMNNASTDKSYVVQGRVDKKTQRVAMTIGDKSDVVLETGLYNLTQAQTPVLVHYGPDRSENYLLVRLDVPSDGSGSNDSTGG